MMKEAENWTNHASPFIKCTLLLSVPQLLPASAAFPQTPVFGSPSPSDQKKELELSDDVRVGDISVAGGGEEEDGQQHVRIVESVNKLLADAQVILIFLVKWENKVNKIIFRA